MKTLKLKKIITLISLLIIILSSGPLYSQDLPEDDQNTPGGSDNVDDQVPIDQDLWLGLIGGCLISIYFISRKQDKTYLTN